MSNTEKIYNYYKQCKSICTDSRSVSKGSIFFALKGDNFDGNKYVLEALEKGCGAAVSSDVNLANYPNVFYASDVLKELQKLANYHRKQLNIPIIAITGTNGKTTTKELVAAVLAKQYRVAYTSGNRNNHIGVPLTLLSMNQTVDVGIIEMGANHIGEIKSLCEIAEPSMGLITNIGKAHLEGFKSIENVMQAKSELYDYLKDNNGVVFCNNDNQTLLNLLGDYINISYGSKGNYFCHGKYIEKSLLASVKWTSQHESGIANTNLIGEYNFENILAAITIGRYFKVPGTAIDIAIQNYFPRNNRSQLVKTRRNSLILDFYNANPTSMMAAINNFENITVQNKGFILGDMLELGTDSLEEHKKILEYIKKLKFKKVFLVGEMFYNFKNEYDFLFFNNVEALAQFFVKEPENASFILVKGSRGIKLEKCIDYL